MPPAIPVTVTCPACQTTFVSQVHNIIDVSQDPDLKRDFLQGKLNVASCPNCGQGGMLSLPFVYHDADKELLLAFVPTQLNMKVEDRERLVGDLVKAVMNATPPEKRKGYLFQPKTLFSMQRLMDDILIADGITQEMLDEQRKAIGLLQELLAVQDNEDSLGELVKLHREELDYQFFLLIGASIDAAEQAGDAEQAQELESLRGQLLELVGPKIPEPLPGDSTKDALIDQLLASEEDEELVGLLISNRPMVDYAFYQTLTGRIEAMEAQGDAEQAEKLRGLRTRVLDVTDELDEQARQMEQQTIGLIEELLASQDQASAIAENTAEFNTYFFMVLGSMMEAARRGDQEVRLGQLQELQRRIAVLLEEKMPPELRLVSHLISADYPEQTAQLLQEHAAEVTEELVGLMKAILGDWEGREDQSEQHAKLEGIIAQASAILSGGAEAA